MLQRLRVALLVESSRVYGLKLLEGIAEYARTHGPWDFFHEQRDIDSPLPKNLEQWRPDGIIARLNREKLLRQVRALGLPTVDLCREHVVPEIPGITSHHEAIAGLACDHFLERGFRHFAYCGFPGASFSDLRAACFQEALAGHGFRAEEFRCPRLRGIAARAKVEGYFVRHGAELAKWLHGLPKPVALLACNDMRGQQVLTICEQVSIAVPDEVAVLGIDNNEVQCGLCNPPMSSIDPDPVRMGYEAAGLLERMLRGEPPPRTRIFGPPRGVVTRRSTDALALADRDVAEAVRFVREHACQPDIEIEDILGHLGFSRATLNRWFRKWLGRPPAAEINRVRLERAKDLLATTDLALETIARRCGFEHVESMCRMVKRTTGRTPGEFRKARPLK